MANQTIRQNDWLSTLHFLTRAARVETHQNQIKYLKDKISDLIQNLYLTTQFRSVSVINRAILSNIGKYFASWEADQTIRISNTENHSLLSESIKHNGPIRGAAFSLNDGILFSWGADNTIRLWNVFNGSN